MKDICGQTVRVGDYVVTYTMGPGLKIGRVTKEHRPFVCSARARLAMCAGGEWKLHRHGEPTAFGESDVVVLQPGLVPAEVVRLLSEEKNK